MGNGMNHESLKGFWSGVFQTTVFLKETVVYDALTAWAVDANTDKHFVFHQKPGINLEYHVAALNRLLDSAVQNGPINKGWF